MRMRSMLHAPKSKIQNYAAIANPPWMFVPTAEHPGPFIARGLYQNAVNQTGVPEATLSGNALPYGLATPSCSIS